MERSYNNLPLNSTQILCPIRNEADKRTDILPSQRMPLIRLPAGSPLFNPGPQLPMLQPLPTFSHVSLLTPSSSSLFQDTPFVPFQSSLMEQSYDNPPLNSTQIPYPVRNEADKRTDILQSQRMPLIRLPAGSPLFSPGPRLPMLQPLPVFSPFSSLTPSSSSLFHGSSSALVENIDYSIGFNNNPSLPPMMNPSSRFNNNPFLPPLSPSVGVNNNSLKPLISTSVGFESYSPMPPRSPSARFKKNYSRPPMNPSIGFNSNHSRPPVISSFGFNSNHSHLLASPSTGLKNNLTLHPMIPSKRSNPMKDPDNTLQQRKAQKRSNNDIVGVHSVIPLNSPELNDPKPSEPLIGESSREKEGVGKIKSDEEFENIFNFNAFINTDFNAFNFNENNDEIFISINNLEDENCVIGNESKTRSTSSGVKIKADQESEISSKHYRSGSLDSFFNELVEKPPLPPVNLNCEVSSTNLVHGNDNIGSDSKHTERHAAARCKAKKDQHIADLEYNVMNLNMAINTLSSQLDFYKKKKSAMMTENEELKIRIELVEQHVKRGDGSSS